MQAQDIKGNIEKYICKSVLHILLVWQKMTKDCFVRKVNQGVKL